MVDPFSSETKNVNNSKIKGFITYITITNEYKYGCNLSEKVGFNTGSCSVRGPGDVKPEHVSPRKSLSPTNGVGSGFSPIGCLVYPHARFSSDCYADP